MAVASEDLGPDFEYRVEIGGTCTSFCIFRDGQPPLLGTDPDDALFLLDKDITIEVQRRRSDLLFLHSAALEWRGKACLLAADSGSGKSTTAWALLHHGFRYLSDELSPVETGCMRVFPYPQAICLKRAPPQPYGLPKGTIDLGRTLHVPVRFLPSATLTGPCPLGAVILLEYSPERTVPNLRRISPAEASARLYPTMLNALSHPNRGLDTVLRIAEGVPCFTLASAELADTCALVRSTLDKVAEG